MRYLYKVCIAVAAIIVIELLKRISGAIWVYKPFHTIFSSLQVTLLLWLTVSIILDLTLFRKLSIRRGIRKTVLVVVVMMVVFELFIVFLLHNPRFISKAMLPIFQGYYDIYERNIIQFNPNCAQYDSSLFYSLIPGKEFAFNSVEFKTHYSTNSKGLRDDEMSLQSPEIIVLGDSYAMGWGVQQNETFAELLEKMTGKKVLNGGMASYGTARELKNLYRLDTSQLKYLIIQYCKNDLEENERFLKNNRLNISSRNTYDTAVQFQYWSKKYFPGKHFTAIAKGYFQEQFGAIGRRIFRKSAEVEDSTRITRREEAENFLDILYNSPLNFNKLKVVVIDMNSLAQINDRFIEKAQSLKYQGNYEQKFKTNLVFIPISKILDSEDYYILDPHLRSSGHLKIAGLLKRYLISEGFGIPHTAAGHAKF